MSNFENYSSVSNVYDNGRVPTGAKVLATMIQGYLNKPLSEAHLLDAGCGTGNYSNAFLDLGIGKVSCFDANEGMLAKTKAKLAGHIENKRVGEIKQCMLPKIPFDDNLFDVIIFMQVLHHVDTPDSNFPNTRASLAEGHRVLKPGGVMIVNFCTPEQVYHGSWYVNLLPRTCQKYSKKYMAYEDLLHHMESLSFQNSCKITCPWETLFASEQYFNKKGPLDENWRTMDSIWTGAVVENEVEDAKMALQAKIDNNSFDEWFEKVENKRKAIGITTSVLVQKLAN